MAKIVFSTWDGGGNVPLFLMLASELGARGHAVSVMGHRSQAGAVESAGLAFVPYVNAQEWSATAEFDPGALFSTWCDLEMGAEVAGQSADLFVLDHLLAGVLQAVADRGTRYVVLEHTLDSVVRSWRTRPLVLEAMSAKGLDRDVLLDGAEACIVPTCPELDPVTAPNAVQTGPFVAGVASSPSEPTVLLSLSTFNYPGVAHMLQHALDSVAGLPARVIASTGGQVSPDDLKVPDNVELHAWVRHSETMPTVSMLFGHGGHSSAMLALAHNLPVVVMPAAAFTDQPQVGRVIEKAGAGRLVDVADDPDVIAAAIDDVLGSAPYRTAASRLGAQINALGGLKRAADLVESRL